MTVESGARRGGRWIAAILLIIGGLLGFLPILGFWMIPLGLSLLAPDVGFIQRFLDRLSHGNIPRLDKTTDDIREDLEPLPEDSRWLGETIHHDGDAYFNGMIAEIEAARVSVMMEVYIFENDALGRRLAEAMGRAARRGLAVRIMVDGIGSPDWAAVFAPDLIAAGARVRIFNPRPWSFWPALARILTRRGRLSALHAQLNRRNHRKVTIIDGQVAWLGSLNVVAKTLRSVSGAAAWRECGLRVEGPEVRVLTSAFGYTWDRIGGALTRFVRPELHRGRLALFTSARHVRFNAPRSLRRRQYGDLLRRLRAARRRLWIETPYFVPPRRLLLALCRAARRGVDLRIILPQEPDHLFMRWIRTPFCRRLLENGARIFEYRPTVLHTKFMIIDEIAIIGSSNLNHRSLLHDLEVDAILEQPASLGNLAARFADDLANATEATFTSIAPPSHFVRLAGNLLFRFRYWM